MSPKCWYTNVANQQYLQNVLVMHGRKCSKIFTMKSLFRDKRGEIHVMRLHSDFSLSKIKGILEQENNHSPDNVLWGSLLFLIQSMFSASVSIALCKYTKIFLSIFFHQFFHNLFTGYLPDLSGPVQVQIDMKLFPDLSNPCGNPPLSVCYHFHDPSTF